MTTKQFDPELHATFDLPGRVAVSNFMWNRYGIFCKPNPDKYGVDLIGYKKGEAVCYVEVEVRQWEPCPYPTIHVAERKRKLFGNDLQTLFFALTRTMRYAYYIDAQHIEHEPLIEVPNKYLTNNEYFFNVPIRYFEYERIAEEEVL